MPTATSWFTMLSSTTRMRPRDVGSGGASGADDGAVGAGGSAFWRRVTLESPCSRWDGSTGLVRLRSMPAAASSAGSRSVAEVSRMIRVSGKRPSPRTIRANCSPLTPGIR